MNMGRDKEAGDTSSTDEDELRRQDEDRRFNHYRENLKAYNKDWIQKTRTTQGPARFDPNSGYGALELHYANNKSALRRVWRQKNLRLIDLRERESRETLSKSESEIRSPESRMSIWEALIAVYKASLGRIWSSTSMEKPDKDKS